jgi:hypothetical protein
MQGAAAVSPVCLRCGGACVAGARRSPICSTMTHRSLASHDICLQRVAQVCTGYYRPLLPPVADEGYAHQITIAPIHLSLYACRRRLQPARGYCVRALHFDPSQQNWPPQQREADN